MGIRIATIDDSAPIIALWHDCNLTRPWNDPHNDFSIAVNGASSDILILENDNQLTGCVMVGFDGHRGWVYYLAVSPAQQGSGNGRALMDAAEAWLCEKSAPKIQLMVRNDNETVRKFYKAIGYDVQDVVTIGKRLT